MSGANLHISVNEKRMLKKREGADYTGSSVTDFEAICQVQPLEMRPGLFLWDKRDLDKWIDEMKEGPR